MERLEYCGHTVNFRSTTRSFKDKAKIHRPKEEWKVFENTHKAIIDDETWELVQELRAINVDQTTQAKSAFFQDYSIVPTAGKSCITA